MLSLFDSSELDTIINQLDNLLMKGHILNTTIFSDFKAKQQEPDFDIDKYIKDPEELINSWFKEVVAILDKNFSERYYLFHFLKPRVLPKKSMTRYWLNIRLFKATYSYRWSSIAKQMRTIM